MQKAVHGLVLLACATALQAAAGQIQPSEGSAAAITELQSTELAQQTETAFGLAASRLFFLDRVPQSGSVALPIEGEEHTVELRPVSVQGAAYQLLVQGPDGIRVGTPGASGTVRGRVLGVDGAELAGSVLEDGLHAMVLMPDGRRLWIEPIARAVPGAAPGEHVLYSDEDRLAAGPGCAVVTPLADLTSAPTSPRGRPLAAAAGSSEPNDLRFTELAVDTDVEYYALRGSVQNVEAEVSNVINIVNLQYERDVRISYLLVHMIVRTSEPDPYNTREPSSLLDQFRNHWFAAQTTVARDVAQLFTGKVLNGGLAGIAYFSGICSDVEGYSLVSQPACPALACKTDLSAHELGHNWAAPHCNCPGWTMFPSIQSANQFHPELTVPVIESYRDTRTCLEVGDDLTGVNLVSPVSSIAETNSVPLAAFAQYRLHADRDITGEASWSVNPASLGSIDSEGVFIAAEVEGSANGTLDVAYEFDGALQTDSVPVSVIDASPAPLRDLVRPDKNRYISLAVPDGLGAVAIRVRMLSLFRPDPPYMAGVAIPNYAEYEGQIRWVGPPSTCTDGSTAPTPFRCALLQCEPHYEPDWGAETVHVTAGEIIPSSQYEVRTFPEICEGNESTCGIGSAPLLVRTQRWGDVVAPFQAPGGATGAASQPDVRDLAAVVDKLKDLPGISQPEADLHGNVPDPNGGISILEVADVVDAIKGFAPLTLGPCPCPTLGSCPLTDACGRCLSEP